MKVFKTYQELVDYSLLHTYKINNTTDEIVDFIKSNNNGYFYLRGADLFRADLKLLNLSGSNLEGANLIGAILYRTILIETNLSGANVARAMLYRTILINAKYSKETIFKNVIYLTLYTKIIRFLRNLEIGFNPRDHGMILVN